ncbi:MAG: monofunctional biosynthetic peptidoglycan transglycosylase [Deltaproteobacteria bacterium]|nr:monofunctional biosynthetic peptidoglycan transglycosylase [Deltaproteobacteria bacterium]
MKKRFRGASWLRVGTILLALFSVYQFWIFAHIWYWVGHNPSTSSFMENRLRILQEQNPDAELRHRWVPYQRISIHLKRAVIAAEDYKFLDHEGFDWEGIQDAVERNLKRREIVAGGSTISQQLAKNLFLSSKRTPWRKGEEAVITLMLETVMTKRRILEIYLNVIEWGDGVFGAAAASRYYYRTNVASLSPDQAARLAAMIPNPRYYDKNRSDPRLARRTRWILWRMRYARVP